jgi:hypothetical protein
MSDHQPLGHQLARTRGLRTGEVADLGDGERLTVAEPTATYRLSARQSFGIAACQRVFVTATSPPEFTLENYRTCCSIRLEQDNMAKAFFNTLTVTIPGDRHSDRDRRLRGLCAGLDAISRAARC